MHVYCATQVQSGYISGTLAPQHGVVEGNRYYSFIYSRDEMLV